MTLASHQADDLQALKRMETHKSWAVYATASGFGKTRVMCHNLSGLCLIVTMPMQLGTWKEELSRARIRYTHVQRRHEPLGEVNLITDKMLMKHNDVWQQHWDKVVADDAHLLTCLDLPRAQFCWYITTYVALLQKKRFMKEPVFSLDVVKHKHLPDVKVVMHTENPTLERDGQYVPDGVWQMKPDDAILRLGGQACPDLPETTLCGINYDHTEHPVMTNCCHQVFDAWSILEWIHTFDSKTTPPTCPNCREVLMPHDLCYHGAQPSQQVTLKDIFQKHHKVLLRGIHVEVPVLTSGIRCLKHKAYLYQSSKLSLQAFDALVFRGVVNWPLVERVKGMNKTLHVYVL